MSIISTDVTLYLVWFPCPSSSKIVSPFSDCLGHRLGQGWQIWSEPSDEVRIGQRDVVPRHHGALKGVEEEQLKPVSS